jgi:hypothetical protein
MKLYMFRTVPQSIIRSYSLYTQQWYMSYSFVDSFRAAAAGSGWNCSSILILLLECCLQTCMTHSIAECKWITPDDGQRNCPKHVEFNFQNKFEKLVHLVGFVVKKFLLFFPIKVKLQNWIRLSASICVLRDGRNLSCRVSLIIEVILTLFSMWRRNRR